MSNLQFGLYARYYDLLYGDKDYHAEAEYIIKNIQIHNPEARKILELGCGTGKYGLLLANHGFEVTGIDQSAEMVKIANENGLPAYQKNITDYLLPTKFDAVVALFHVISYLNSNKEIEAAFEKAALHLTNGGVFIFDVWYLPAVLFLKPEKRIKTVSDDQIEVKRFADPIMDHNKNVVHIQYDLMIQEKNTGLWHNLKETHSMRYFSIPEIELFAKQAGLKLIKTEEFLTGKNPEVNSWGVCFILQKMI